MIQIRIKYRVHCYFSNTFLDTLTMGVGKIYEGKHSIYFSLKKRKAKIGYRYFCSISI